MAFFRPARDGLSLVRQELRKYEEEPPEMSDEEAALRTGRLLSQGIGVDEDAEARARVAAATMGGWRYDPRVREALAIAEVRESAPLRQYGGAGGAAAPDGHEDPLVVQKSDSDKTGEIPKMPYDFFVGQPPFRAILVGSTMSGKTTLQHFLLLHHYGPYFRATGGGIVYISATAKTDEVMKDPRLRPFIVWSDTKVNERRLRELRERNEAAIAEKGKANAPQYLIVLNDFASSEGTMKSELFDELFMLWRHFNFSILVDTQQYVRLSTRARANFQLGFLFDAVGYEMEHYQDQTRVRVMPEPSAFRDMFAYALEPNDEQRAKQVRKAHEQRELMPEAARSYNFLTINRQTNPRFWYRRNLNELLEIGEDGWLAEPHMQAHYNNRQWQRHALDRATLDSEALGRASAEAAGVTRDSSALSAAGGGGGEGGGAAPSRYSAA